MDREVVLGVIFVALLVLVALIAKLSIFFRTFAVYTHRICQQMESAASYEEYHHWRGVLRCHYLMLIPFVTPKNVKRVCRFFFHDGESAKKKERKDGLVPLLLPSVLGICICVVCLCSMTWAWYTVSIEAPAQKITTSYFKVTVKSIKVESGPAEATEDSADLDTNDASDIQPEKGGGYELKADTTYTVVLEATGTVENSGYCLIENVSNKTKSYTDPFKPGEVVEIYFYPVESGTYTFTGVWGNPPAESGGSLIVYAPPSAPDEQDPGLIDDDTAPDPSTEPVTEPTGAPEPPNTATDDPKEIIVILD